MQCATTQAVQRNEEVLTFQEVRFLNVRVHPLTMPQLNALIARIIDSGERRIISNHNVHSVYLCHRDDKMAAFYERADFVHVDGMALVLLGRLLGLPLQRSHRVTYVDWTSPLLAVAAAQKWRVFFLGGRPDIVSRAVEILRQRFPGLQVQFAHGYFNAYPGSEDNRALLAQINAFRPNLLLVGMGMPRQEHWILDHLESLDTNVILTAGAALDYVAGSIPTPPRWSGQVGLEWFFRLMSEPRRLCRRYLLEPWVVIRIFLSDYLWIRLGLRRDH